MNFLAIDIGGGTQDICYYNGSDIFENSFKMVTPTPSKIIENKISSINGDLYISGNVIGGGNLISAIKDKISLDKNVFISRSAYATLRDDIDYVKNLGVMIVEDIINPNVIFDEFQYDTIYSVLSDIYATPTIDKVLVAVQDHGYIKGQKDRVTRFDFLKNLLKNGLKKAYFSNFSEIPENFTRLKSIYKSIENKCGDVSIHLSDTAVVGAIGAASVTDIRPIVTVDAGNCHTFAALIGEDDKVYSFFEHHTSMLNKDSVKGLIEKLQKGIISNDEIFNNDGHGAYIYEKINAANCPVFVTGPNRNKLFSESENIIFSHPKGDTMMAGPIGLLLQSNVNI